MEKPNPLERRGDGRKTPTQVYADVGMRVLTSGGELTVQFRGEAQKGTPPNVVAHQLSPHAVRLQYRQPSNQVCMHPCCGEVIVLLQCT